MFAAVMITCNGIVGIALLIGGVRFHVTMFNAEGRRGAALDHAGHLELSAADLYNRSSRAGVHSGAACLCSDRPLALYPSSSSRRRFGTETSSSR